jgi:hypothetical protein
MPTGMNLRFCVFILLNLMFAPALYGQTQATPGLTCGPAPCVLPNVQVSQSSFILPSSLSLDPADSQHLVTGESDLTCSSVYVSNDGGGTWTTNCSKAGGWAAYAFGPRGEIKGTGTGPDRSCAPDCDENVLQFSTSSDNGVTWSNPVRSAPHALGFGVVDASISIDNNPSSPRYGSIYVSGTQFGDAPLNTAIGVSHSTDNGATWKLIAVDSPQKAPLEDSHSRMTIGGDGTVYVTWLRCAVGGSGTSCPGKPATLFFSKSTDGGNTWSAPTQMGSPMLVPNNPQCGSIVIENLPNTCWFSQNEPVIAIDNSGGAFSGRLYATFYNWTGTFMQVVAVNSIDGGSTWSAPVPVAPASDTHDQFSPAISVSDSGMVGVTWLDRRKDPANLKYQPFAGFSRDGGASFFKNVPLSATASNPGISQTGFTYPVVNVWSGNTLNVLWDDTRTGSILAWFGGVVIK